MATLLQSESRRLYSWWWDSHISPKNSKWLQENLTDMDAKVKAMIKLIEEDADSFARRAEMYYKKRPELMKLVEEFYRAYRALAERYDHATGELRQAHRTMVEAFPNQVPFALTDDSPSGSSPRDTEPHTPEIPHSICAFLNLDDLHKDALGFSASDIHGVKRNGSYSAESDAGISEKDLKQLHEMFGAAVVPQNSKLAEGMRKGLKYEMEDEEESLHDEASQLSNENQNLNAKVLSEPERAGKAESELQNLKNALVAMQAEKEAVLLQYQQSLEKLSDLERKILIAEENARLLNERADRAETEVKRLEKALTELNEEREAAALQHKLCLEKICKLESEISCAQEDVERLSSEILMGAVKPKSAEEKGVLLEISNQSLRQEADNLAKKIVLKDQELSEKHVMLDKLHVCVQDERSRYVKVEAALQSLQNLHSKSQEEQRALTLELENGLQMLKDLESCKRGLEEEIRRVKDENQTLNEQNSSSTVSMGNLQNEILSLRKIKERLEEEVSLQMGQSNALQKDIYRVKEEIKGLNRSYQALVKQVELVGFDPECFGSSVKDLQDENLKLRLICEKERHEKTAVFKKLENMEELLEKNAALQSSLSDVNSELEGSQEKVRALQESCKFLQVEKSSLVAEKAVLLSQLQVITENMQKLLEKNTVLENSLSVANVEFEHLRVKSNSLEELCQLLDNEKSNLLTERSTLVVQLEDVKRRLVNLENRFTQFEEKFTCLEKEKESTHTQVEELQVTLCVEKQERASLEMWSETRFATLENYIDLLQGESKWRKKDFQEELDKAVIAQFEIFILQKFIQDMEEKNYSLSIECQKHIEASKLTEKLISELGSENLEQQVEAELLLVEIENLRLGMCQVFKALELGQGNGFEDKIENQQISVHHILGNIENMKCSILKYNDDQQQIFIENSVFLALLGQMRLEGFEIESEKKNLNQAFKIMKEQLVLVQNEKHELLEMTRQLRSEVSKGDQHANVLKTEVESLYVQQSDLQRAYLELQEEYSKALEENRCLLKLFSDLKEEKCMVEEENNVIVLETLALDNLFTIFKSLDTDKAAELKLRSEDLHNLRGVNGDLEKEVNTLRGKLDRKETENLFLIVSVEKLEMELSWVKDSNDRLKHEISSGKDLLSQRETELSEAEQKLKATENLNSELCKTVEGLKTEHEESELTRENLEKHILKLSEDNMNQNKEIECHSLLLSEAEQKLKATENLNSELCKTVEGLKMEHEESELIRENLEKHILKLSEDNRNQNKEIECHSLLLSEAEQKLKATENLNSELCKTVEGLTTEREESELIRENLEKHILKLSEDNMNQNKEIECLREANGNLESELCILHEEIEERRIREENLSSTLQERSNEFELWEDEATTFYFDLQISAIREVLFEDKVHKLTGVCESLEEERAAKVLEMERMKERVSFMESEIGGLKAQLFAYAPVVVSLRENIDSLERNMLSGTKLIVDDNQKPQDAEVAVHSHEKSCQEMMEDQNSPMPNGISDLQELQTRIKAVEKVVVDEISRLVMQENLSTNLKLETAMQEIEELKSKCSPVQENGKQKEDRVLEDEPSETQLQKNKPEISEVKNGILMKDILLDQASEGLLYGMGKRRKGGSDNQMLELRETAKEDQGLGETVNELQMQAYEQMEDDILCHQFEDVEQKIEDPSSELQVEKELGVDKLQVSMSITVPNQGGNKEKILEILSSDAKKLTSLQTTVEDLRRKLETNKKSKNAKDVDIETVNEQLQEFEETVVQLFELNEKLANNIEESTSCSNGKASAELGELNGQIKRVSEQARKGSERIGRLQLEVQKIQYILLKLEEENKSKGQNKFSTTKSRTSIVMRDFFNSGRRCNGRRKKACLRGCFGPSTNGDSNHS